METLIDGAVRLFFDPAVQVPFWAIVGILVKSFAPAWVPLLGAAKKAVDELAVLHHEAQEPDEQIVNRALASGKTTAAQVISRKFMERQ